MGGNIREVGAFAFTEELSRGNTGRVFLSEDPKRRLGDDGVCVVKLFDEPHTRNSRFVGMLRREAPAAVRFTHTYAARNLDVAYTGTHAYVVRELVDGMPFCSLMDAMQLEKARLPWEFVVTLGVQLARLFGTASAAAEGAQVKLLHGHLSCSSVYLTFSGYSKVVGLGLGHARSALPVGARQLPFRAPELLLGERLSSAADVYGIGATMHGLLGGRRPFEGGCVTETRQAILHDAPPSLRDARPEIPAELEALIASLMAKRPQHRPTDLAQIEASLRGLLREPDAFYADGLSQMMQIYFPKHARRSQDQRAQARLRRRLRGPGVVGATPPVRPARPTRRTDDSDSIRTRLNGGDSRERLRRARGSDPGDGEVIQGPWAEKVNPSLAGIDRDQPFDVGAVVDAIVDAARDRIGPDPLADLVIEAPEEAPFDGVTPVGVEHTSDLLLEADRGLEAGTVIGGRYQVIDVLGQGGASVVYRAEHTALCKQVAVKVLKPELSAHEEAAQRFQQEARAMSALDHPNVARVTDFGRTHNASLFLVMELVDGICLADMLRTQPRPPPSVVLAIALEILEGLRHAHAHGVVHRDLKPDNVMVQERSDGLHAKVLDFGIAKMLEPSFGSRSTLPGRVFGTPRYMAPEQAQGMAVDGRADLYSVGVCMYEMLDGRPPFPGEHALKVLTDVLHREPPPLVVAPSPTLRSERVAAVVSRAMQKDPARRFPNVDSMVQALRDCFYFTPKERSPSPRPQL